MELLSAYSTPPQLGTSGKPLLFDKNSLIYGNAVTHVEGSGTFKIDEPGIYFISYNGGMSPAKGVSFPMNIIVYLEVNGTAVPGTNSQHTFQSSSESINQSFSVPIEIVSAPATLTIVATGGKFFYSTSTVTIQKLGELSS